MNEPQNPSQRASPSILIYHNNVKLFIKSPCHPMIGVAGADLVSAVYWQQASGCAQQSPIGQHALAAKADAPNKITMVIKLTTGKEKRDFMSDTPDS